MEVKLFVSCWNRYCCKHILSSAHQHSSFVDVARCCRSKKKCGVILLLWTLPSAITVNVPLFMLGCITGECFDTQCLRTFRTLLVAARLITNSLSPFLWSVGKPAENGKVCFYTETFIIMIGKQLCRQSEAGEYEPVLSELAMVQCAILGSLLMLTNNCSWTFSLIR